MSLVGFGDLARPQMLQRQNSALQARLLQLSEEVSTDRIADPGQALGGDFTGLAALEHSLSALDGYDSSASLAALYTATQQTSLQAIDDSANTLSTALLQIGSAAGQAQTGVVASQGRDALSAALSALNARAGNRSVFAGAASDGPAVAGIDTIMGALQTAVAGQTTAGGMIQAVRDWFATPGGFDTVGYLGAGTAPPVPIAEGQGADVSTTALSPAIVDTLTGFALAALVGQPAVAGDVTAQADVAAAAGEQLIAAAAGRTEVAAQVGVSQARIADVQTRNGAERTALDTARNDLLAVDPYKAATDLQQMEAQIQTLYALTARIAGLSLVNFLK